jgi:hypothetical protein
VKAGVNVVWRVQEEGAVARITDIVAGTNITVVWYPKP